MSGLFVFQFPFSFKVWPDLERNQDSADSPGELLRPLIRSCFLLPPPREALLACPPSPPWNLPSFTVECTLSSSCFRFDSPFFRQGVALAHLDSLSLLTIWRFGQTVLFLFLLAREAPAYLPTAHFVALRLLYAFQQAQYAQVFR